MVFTGQQLPGIGKSYPSCPHRTSSGAIHGRLSQYQVSGMPIAQDGGRGVLSHGEDKRS